MAYELGGLTGCQAGRLRLVSCLERGEWMAWSFLSPSSDRTWSKITGALDGDPTSEPDFWEFRVYLNMNVWCDFVSPCLSLFGRACHLLNASRELRTHKHSGAGLVMEPSVTNPAGERLWNVFLSHSYSKITWLSFR